MNKVVSGTKIGKDGNIEALDIGGASDDEVLEAEHGGVVIHQTFYINDVNIYVSHTEINRDDIDESDDDV